MECRSQQTDIIPNFSETLERHFKMKISIGAYLIITSFLVSSCENENPRIDVSHEHQFSSVIGKTYCLKKDMYLIKSHRHASYDSGYFLSKRPYDGDPTYGKTESMILKNTKVDFIEVWLRNDSDNESVYGTLSYQGKLKDKVKRDYLIGFNSLTNVLFYASSKNNEEVIDWLYLQECNP